MSRPPKRATVASIACCTSSARRTSALSVSTAPGPADFDGRARRRQMGFAAAGRADLHALGHQCARDRETDTARSAGDDGDLAAKRLHSHYNNPPDARSRDRRRWRAGWRRRTRAGPPGRRPFDRARRRERPRRRRQGARHRAGRAGRRFCDASHRNRRISRPSRAVQSSSWQSAWRQGPWSTDEGLLLLKRLLQTAPRAVFLCAGPSSRELVERGVRELRIDRRRLFGTAPEALAAGARALVALSANGSPRDVAFSVLGVPPSHTVIPWAGRDDRRLRADAPARRAGAAHAGRADCPLWPPGSYALASAAAAVVEAMAGRSRRTACCFVVNDVGSGTRARAAALPVRVDAAGIREIIQPTLSVVEQVALDNAMML